MIEALLVLVSPFLVKEVTERTKKLDSITNHNHRVAIIRALVAVFAVISAVLSQLIGEGTLEVGLVETALYAVASAGVATYLYYKEKNKDAS